MNNPIFFNPILWDSISKLSSHFDSPRYLTLFSILPLRSSPLSLRTRQISNLFNFVSTFPPPGGVVVAFRAEFKRHICTRATRERVKSARNLLGRPLRLEILEQGQVQLFRSVWRVPGVSTLSTQPPFSTNTRLAEMTMDKNLASAPSACNDRTAEALRG